MNRLKFTSQYKNNNKVSVNTGTGEYLHCLCVCLLNRNPPGWTILSWHVSRISQSTNTGLTLTLPESPFSRLFLLVAMTMTTAYHFPKRIQLTILLLLFPGHWTHRLLCLPLASVCLSKYNTIKISPLSIPSPEKSIIILFFTIECSI